MSGHTGHCRIPAGHSPPGPKGPLSWAAPLGLHGAGLGVSAGRPPSRGRQEGPQPSLSGRARHLRDTAHSSCSRPAATPTPPRPPRLSLCSQPRPPGHGRALSADTSCSWPGDSDVLWQADQRPSRPWDMGEGGRNSEKQA